MCTASFWRFQKVVVMRLITNIPRGQLQDMYKTKKEMEGYLMPPAGLTTHQNMRGSAIDCMTFRERPPTPEDIKKFRRSANLEPGKRFQNPRTVADIENLRLEHRTYGVTSRSSEATTSELLSQNRYPNVVAKLNMAKAENIYHTGQREPLGKTYSRKHQIPSKFAEGKMSVMNINFVFTLPQVLPLAKPPKPRKKMPKN